MISNQSSITEFLVHFGILFGFFIAFGSLFRDALDKKISYSYAAISITVSLILVPISLISLEITIPHLLWPVMLMPPFIIGPLLYVYSGFISGYLYDSDVGYKRHFLYLVIVFFALFFIFYGAGLEFGTPEFVLLIRITMCIQSLHVMFYSFLVIKKILNELHQIKERRDEIHGLILMITGYILAIIIMTLPVIVMGMFYHPSFICGTLIIAVHYLLTQKFPF